MKLLSVLAVITAALAASFVAAQGSSVGDARGQLLYSTYCIGCHTTQMHWRDKKLATDWGSLRDQVRQWQERSAPGLTDDDVTAITRHLNDLYYRFPVTEERQSG